MAIIFPFGEGKTEKVVFDFIRGKLELLGDFREFNNVGGKNNFRSQILEIVQPDVEAHRDVRILVFRDLDNGEEPEEVAQSFRDIVWNLLKKWNLRPRIKQHRCFSNIFTCEHSKHEETPELRLVLHIADNSTLELPVSLLNQTTDGYLLAVGLLDSVLDRFAREPKVNSDRQTLYTLITDSIPSTINRAGITFNEDKDYLAAYLATSRFWVVKRAESRAQLAKIILARTWKYAQDKFSSIFASWITAIQEVIR